jgi:hypothetical protein
VTFFTSTDSRMALFMFNLWFARSSKGDRRPSGHVRRCEIVLDGLGVHQRPVEERDRIAS